jgi:MSHA biogenesis protein MshP
MCPDRSFCHQRGAGLPIALFVITVLSLLVLGMSQLQQGASQSLSLQIQSQRAFFAAESGAQSAVRKALDGGCPAVDSASPLNFSAGGLASCSASLACESVTADISGPGENTVYTIRSTGSCGNDPYRTEREIEVRVR